MRFSSEGGSASAPSSESVSRRSSNCVSPKAHSFSRKRPWFSGVLRAACSGVALSTRALRPRSSRASATSGVPTAPRTLSDTPTFRSCEAMRFIFRVSSASFAFHTTSETFTSRRSSLLWSGPPKTSRSRPGSTTSQACRPPRGSSSSGLP